MIIQTSTACTDCDMNFSDVTQVATHLGSTDGPEYMFCDRCQITFLTKSLFNEHYCLEHGTKAVPFDQSSGTSCRSESQSQQTVDLYRCKFCEKSFSTRSCLDNHIPEHVPSQQYKCYKCDYCFSSYTLLATHVNNYHESQPNVFITPIQSSSEHLASVFSPIPQFDGLDDTSVLAPVQPSFYPTAENVRVAPYLLDRKKQLSKLAEDADINDFDIEVSPAEHNVNVQCSTGFYSLVVVPAFSTISTGYSVSVAGLNVSCFESTGKVDRSSASINTVYFLHCYKNWPTAGQGHYTPSPFSA